MSPSSPVPYFPPNNGQYYGGWVPPPPGVLPSPSMHPQQHPYHAQPYPHGGGRPSPGPQPIPLPPPPPPTQQLTQTATIRNSVNLKKSSLKVTPLTEDPSKLLISFSFDASAPCVASTFVLATEDGALGNKLTTAHQPPAPKVKYPKGLHHKFPPLNTTNDSSEQQPIQQQPIQQQHLVDVSLHKDDLGALSSANEDTYPLVIRLEVITERGLRDGHSLDELQPGEQQQTWIQSQTTFAALHREDDGSWSVRVLKQNIWVEGTSYELQEIYGLEQASGRSGGGSGSGGGLASSSAAAAAAEEAEERLCVICLVNPRDTTVLPCRHMCLCSECASELRKQSSKCPICRYHIESLLHIRINKPVNTTKGGG